MHSNTTTIIDEKAHKFIEMSDKYQSNPHKCSLDHKFMAEYNDLTKEMYDYLCQPIFIKLFNKIKDLFKRQKD